MSKFGAAKIRDVQTKSPSKHGPGGGNAAMRGLSMLGPAMASGTASLEELPQFRLRRPAESANGEPGSARWAPANLAAEQYSDRRQVLGV